MEKNREFLNYFWDLASEDNRKRLQASQDIIQYLKRSAENGEIDIDYVSKRLVRGLSSSRSHARAGFSTCLTEFISFNFIEVDSVISLIDETTKTSGSLKRGEERDFMLGKLFGVLSIMKSQKVLIEKSQIEYILTTLLQLHSWKGWIKELIAESILYLISVVPNEQVNAYILPKLSELVKDTSLEELAAWQIVLLCGLESYAKRKPMSRKQIQLILPTIDSSILSAQTLEILKPTLLLSTHGFPKIHRVWSSILATIFPECPHLALETTCSTSNPITRCKVLKRSEEDLLIQFSNFIDKNLIVNSHEKRGVAYHLLIEIAKRAPTSSFNLCISKRMIKSLVSARINKKHTLHIISEATLKALVSAMGNENEARLIMASLLVQHGGANFDHKTKTKCIQSLLEGLDESEVISHVKHLCHLLRNYSIHSLSNINHTLSTVTSTVDDEIAQTDNDSDEIDPESNDVDASLHNIQGIIDVLISLSKNSNIRGRFSVNVITGLVLLRMTYFSDCVSSHDMLASISRKNRKSTSKQNKNKLENNLDEQLYMEFASYIFGGESMNQSKSHTTLNTSDVLKIAFQCLDIVNGWLVNDTHSGANGNIDTIDTSQFSKEIRSYAAVKFHSLISESGYKSFIQFSMPIEQQSQLLHAQTNNKDTNSGSYSLLQILTNLTEKMIESGCVLASTVTIPSCNIDEDAQEARFETKEAIKAIKCAFKFQNKLKQYIGSNDDKLTIIDKDMIKKYTQLCDALISFISHAIFNILCSENGELEILEDIGAICYDLVTFKNRPALNGDDKNDEKENDTDDNNPQVRLFEITMDFLSLPDDQSIRGIRDIIKKIWIHVTSIFPIFDEVIDSIVSVITNDDDGDDDHEENEEAIEEDDDNVIEEDEKSKIDEEENSSTSSDIDENENGNDDILVSEDNIFNLLNDDDDDMDLDITDTTGNMRLMHEGTPEQDAALVQLIELRKKSRKLGLLNAQKHQFLIRTRAVDILDAIVNQFSSDRLMLMIPIFLKTLKSVYSSSSLMSIQECLSFCQKLKSLVEDKICKGKQNKSKSKHNDSNHTAEGGVKGTDNSNTLGIVSCAPSNDELENILNEIIICVKSPIAPLKHMASNCLFRVCKTILFATDHHPTKGSVDSSDTLSFTVLNTKISELLEYFKSKKNSKVSRKIFEDLFVRFPDFSISCLLKNLMLGCSESKSFYIQTECCDILTAVLSRFKTLSTESQQHILKNAASFLNELSKVVEILLLQIQQKQTDFNVCGKRLKVFISCGKHTLFCLKQSATNNNYKLKKTDTQSIQSFISKSNQVPMKLKEYFSDSNKEKTHPNNNNLISSLESTLKSINQITFDFDKTQSQSQLSISASVSNLDDLTSSKSKKKKQNDSKTSSIDMPKQNSKRLKTDV